MASLLTMSTVKHATRHLARDIYQLSARLLSSDTFDGAKGLKTSYPRHYSRSTLGRQQFSRIRTSQRRAICSSLDSGVYLRQWTLASLLPMSSSAVPGLT